MPEPVVVRLDGRSEVKAMGLFRGAKYVNTLAWSTPSSDRGSPQFSASGSRGDALRERKRGSRHWERAAKWERNYEAWMAHTVSALR
jgi:hypothetical protein